MQAKSGESVAGRRLIAGPKQANAYKGVPLRRILEGPRPDIQKVNYITQPRFEQK